VSAATGPLAAGFAGQLAGLRLVDHHAHSVLITEVDRAGFEALLTESDRPAAAGTSRWESQLGIAVRRWCAPVLGLAPWVPAGEYLARRAELGAAEAARLLLRASGTGHYLIDTGYPRPGLASLAELAGLAAAPAGEIVRLEQVAEQVITAGDGTAAGFAARFRAALWERTARASGVKSIIAYRFGLDFDPEPPEPAEVTAAAGRWLRTIEQGRGQRIREPALLRHLLWAGVERGLPVQIHTGFGDPDADLRRSDPLLLRGFIEAAGPRGVPVMLLHCYPYHRQAGYLAHAYPHVYADVGLALTHLGSRATAVVAESLELAPFAQVLYSSDGFGLPELHYLGALAWRRAMAEVIGDWVGRGDWSLADAARVVSMIGAGNARRVYRLAPEAAR
jgi:predicted TIM-barrel fold metal-dependent hydrolase